VAEGETLWGCRQCDYDKCQQCVSKANIEFTDTDGDNIVIVRSDLGMDYYENEELKLRDLF